MAAEEPKEVAPADSLHSAPMSLDVLSLVNDDRASYGLRYDDYKRYREHCTRRVRHLRQILKLTQKNDKQVNKRKELPEQYNDIDFLRLFVYETERAWAYAMELKKELSEDHLRKKYHLKKRLRRAAQYAKLLYVQCKSQKVDSRTLLHAQAYTAVMDGHYSLHQEHWREALDQYAKARTIYDGLRDTADGADIKNPYSFTMDDIDGKITACAFKLRHSSDSPGMDLETIIRNAQEKDSSGYEHIVSEIASLRQARINKAKPGSKQSDDRAHKREARDGVEPTGKHTKSRVPALESPPSLSSLKPMACKPFFFDLSANFVKYPTNSLEKPAQESALPKSLSSWLRWGN